MLFIIAIIIIIALFLACMGNPILLFIVGIIGLLILILAIKCHISNTKWANDGFSKVEIEKYKKMAGDDIQYGPYIRTGAIWGFYYKDCYFFTKGAIVEIKEDISGVILGGLDQKMETYYYKDVSNIKREGVISDIRLTITINNVKHEFRGDFGDGANYVMKRINELI